MVVTDAVQNASELSLQDNQIANAISAWLCALNLIDSGLSFESATRQCISLCRVFSLFAPQLLSERDFFIPAPNAEANLSRHRRYNTRRLARCLVRYFHLKLSDPNLSLPDVQSPQPLVQLRQTARDTILSLSEAARTEDVEPVPVMLSLAEVVLCAAVHSDKREPFIKAVLTLAPDHQDALAASICRTTVEKPKDTRVLGQIPVNDENINSKTATAPSRKSGTMDKGSTPLSTPRGIPLADYKALAAERDNLRRKLAACEFEKNKAVELFQGLKTNLEEASDKIRLLETKQEESEAELVAKSKALNEAKSELRGAHAATEEFEVVRAKAASAEKLEASLKRASKRLEELCEIRRVNADLEAQVSAFRETEERLSKHAEYLEAQLTYSNTRSTQFAKLSETLSAEMEKKDIEIKALKSENGSLKTSMETANQQLAAFLMQSAQTASRDTGINRASEDMSASIRTPKSLGGPKTSDQTTPKTVQMSDELVKERACDILFKDIGARMTWEDIVECIDGVMDALKDLDAMEDGAEPCLGSSSEASIERNPSVSGARQPSMQSRPSQQSVDTNTSYIGSEAESRMSLLPEFDVMDYQERVQKGHSGDEFDYAANHTNVEEIPLDRTRPPTSEAVQEQKNINPMAAEGTSSLSATEDESDCEAADETVNATIPQSLKPAPITQPNPSSCVRRNSGIDSLKRSPTQPHSPFIADDIMPGKGHTIRLQFGSKHLHSVRHSSLIQLKTFKRASSLTLSKRSGVSSNHSRSDTTRLILQTRNDLLSLQNTLDLMRTERQSSRSVGNLVHQLDVTRKQLHEAQAKLLESNAECSNLRFEMDLLLKEVDVLSAAKEKKNDDESKILEEKERLIEHLRDTLKLKEDELSVMKRKLKATSEHVENLEQSRKSLEEKLRTSKVVERAQEVEIARLNAKLETSEVMAAKLDAVMKRADGLQKEISKERENHLQGIAEAVKREQRIAEEARKEARMMAKNHTTMLEDVRASALAAARGSMRANQERVPRRGAWFTDFWRRLLHLERLNSDFSTSHTVPTSAAESGQRGRSVRVRRQ
eukprot:TRINITY_DN1599_c0_g1_i1.p1 TRINITY_DN1599_c0_g1~~TRINITY_DN1599_c0_g1_i1.p1  ORF type:complete len:1060 (-),score=230.55 TRINITY_DN1599_c0_g1_i1:3223-6402(-)